MIRRIFHAISRRKPSSVLIEPEKICIFKVGAIGDVLMSTPMVRALREKFPKALIDYWTGKWSAGILEGNPCLDNVFSFDDSVFHKKKPGLALKLAGRIRRQKYDVMFVLDKHWSLGVFGCLCGVPVRVGFDREGEGFAHTVAIPYLPVRHEVDYYLDLAYAVGAEKVSEPKLEFVLNADDEGFAENFFEQHGLVPERTIGFVPGGARNPGQDMAVRRWPVERFAQVAKVLSENGWQILLIGKSPGDDDVLPVMKKAVPDAINAIGNLTLKQSSALMKSCRVVLCNDAGPMHLACAVGTPTISIFGATDPRRKAPRGGQHKWLWSPVDCVRAEAYGKYNEPRLASNILKVQPGHVLKAVFELVGERP